MKEFINEAFVDFTNPTAREDMLSALAKVRSQFGQTYPMWVDGNEVTVSQTFASTNPSNPSEVIGQFQKGTKVDVENAIESAYKTFPSWSQTSPTARAEYLFKAADLMRKRKYEFSAMLVYEVGKTWAEADGDTAEAIDFMEFYAREMLRLDQPQPLTKIPGEKNELKYIPLGVGAVIPPWNFPLAICVGMTTAALVSGNTVVLKPASDSPNVAYHFVKLLHEVGLPKDVVQFVTGGGAELGDTLVSHPKVRFISFTGSKEVGLRINELASKHQPGQKWIKRVIAEMGGKDAIYVDENANIEEAAKGIVSAAFGFQGQKCSACSRAIVHAKVYDQVRDRVVALTKEIKIGNPADASTQLGPVINGSAQKKILAYIETGKSEGKLLVGGKAHGDNGYFIEPTIFEDIQSTDRLFQEEIFGPVLAFTKVKDFEEGMKLFNDTEFGLTGAIYSTSRDHLDIAKRNFHCGNLYLNRKCTGALVGVHPFGGFNMSGTDSKAGGHDYLLLFTQAKLISEKI